MAVRDGKKVQVYGVSATDVQKKQLWYLLEEFVLNRNTDHLLAWWEENFPGTRPSVHGPGLLGYWEVTALTAEGAKK